MGLCLTGKCADCKRNCKSWFPGDVVMQDACKAKCKASNGNSPTSREDYLNQIGAGSDAIQAQADIANATDEKFNERLKLAAKIAAFVLLVVVFIVVLRRLTK